MLTKEDKKYLNETFTAKKEVSQLCDDVDALSMQVAVIDTRTLAMQSHIDDIKASQARTEIVMNKILGMQDGYAGKVADLEQENKMGAITLRRHDTQIKELARATGTTIPK